MPDLLQDRRRALIAERKAADAAKASGQPVPVAPPAITPETPLPEAAAAPTSFSYGEALKQTATAASKLNQQQQLDERFKSLGLESMVGSQVGAGFMGKLVSAFKNAKDRGVLNVLGYAEREQEAKQKETEKQQAVSIKMIDILVERGGLSSLSGSVLRDYEKSAGYQSGYLSALKESEIELEEALKAKNELEVQKAQQNIDTLKAQAENYRASASKSAAGEALGGGLNPANSKTGAYESPDGSFTFGEALQGRVECGEWLNDTFGTPHAFGSTFESKVRNTPSKKPIAGGTFSVDIGDYGHCGAVEAVNPDGSIRIKDYNRNLDGSPMTTTIKPNTNGEYIINGQAIAGFGSGFGKGGDVDSLIDEFNLATTPSGQQKIIDKANKQGLFEEFNEKLVDITVQDPTSQSILSQTGLSTPAFGFLTKGAPALARMTSALRVKYMKEAEKWSIENNIDTSTFQAQYSAYEKTITANTLRNNQAKIAEKELEATLKNVKEATDETEFMSLRWVNVAKLFAGKEFNDPAVTRYAFHLNQLRKEFELYNAALSGQIDDNGNVRATTQADTAEAERIIKDGFAAGSIEGFEEALQSSMEKMSVVLEGSIESQQDLVWDLFGVEKPKELAPSIFESTRKFVNGKVDKNAPQAPSGQGFLDTFNLSNGEFFNSKTPNGNTTAGS